MLNAQAFGGSEIIQIADAVAREKGIQKDVVLDAMEDSIAVAARKKYGYDRNIFAVIDRKTGHIQLYRQLDVVEDDFVPEEDEPKHTFITLSEAKERDATLEVGGAIKEPLPPIDLGRVAAQTAKQVIMQKVRDAERDRQFEEFKPRIGEVMSGAVKRLEFGNIIIDLGGSTEGIVTRDQVIRGEAFKVGDRIRAYMMDVRRETRGPQIFLSRTAPEFMSKLFAQEVPEIYDNIIEIRSVAREPGSRAKIAVTSNDSNIDPVASCVGMRGARVQAVIAELQGEKIDVIQWSPDTATYLVSAIAPADVTKVVIDEDAHRIDVVVPEDQLSLAIGRRGQNVRLASELVGWRLDVMTEDEESTRRTEDFSKLSALFTEALNVEDIISHLLVSEGFNSIEDIAYIELEELTSVEGFDENIAAELQSRAVEFLEHKKEKAKEQLLELGVEKELIELEGITDDMLVALGSNGLKTLDDFADLSRDEVLELAPDCGLQHGEIDDLIMRARAHWFDEEAPSAEKTKAEGSDAETSKAS